MAEKKKTEAGGQPREEIFIPKGGAREEPNFQISVNGVNYVLPRGKTVTVPRAVAFEYHRAMAAQEALDEKMKQMAAQAAPTHR